jgi:hypothetical protein
MGSLAIRNLPDGRLIREFAFDSGAGAEDICFSPEGRCGVFCEAGDSKVVDLETGSQAKLADLEGLESKQTPEDRRQCGFYGHRFVARAAAYTEDGKHLLLLTPTGRLIWVPSEDVRSLLNGPKSVPPAPVLNR